LEPIVGSSNVAATGHDPRTNTLRVRFQNGSTYQYDGVTAGEHSALRGADSVGSHLHKHIIKKYAGIEEYKPG
jgi:hypothetical protein